MQEVFHKEPHEYSNKIEESLEELTKLKNKLIEDADSLKVDLGKFLSDIDKRMDEVRSKLGDVDQSKTYASATSPYSKLNEFCRYIKVDINHFISILHYLRESK